MLKLSDIIKSGGGNAKINRFINRYVLSKKEKKDIVNEIKTKGSSSSGSSSKYAPRYYKFDNELDIDVKESILIYAAATVKVKHNQYSFVYIENIYIYDNNNTENKDILGFSFIPLANELVGEYQYIGSIDIIISIFEQSGVNLREHITEITEEEYYKID